MDSEVRQPSSQGDVGEVADLPTLVAAGAGN
jgi:hypothetical protein